MAGKSRRQPPRPTDAEMAILRVLWQRGEGTVRDVLDALNGTRAEPFAYTTVLRFLQIMTGKGLVSRRDGQRGHIYFPSAPAERTQRQMVGDLVERVFGGSVQDLVIHALGSKRIAPAELRAIRKLIDEAEP